MSFLTPLYILGALTIAAPLIFHLIRRTTKGETPFSSLIFLAPSPPRLTRRSRLENWPLLLLRALALALLAAAFARPFLRESAALNLDAVVRTRIVLLIDVSASMRRGDLWTKAKAKALDVIASARPEDQLAVLAFDASTRSLLGFEESVNLDPSRRRAVATALVEGLSPTWDATHLGQALIDASGTIENVGDKARESSKTPRRIILISDMQQGGRLEALGDFEWPADVELDVRAVVDDGSNASIEGLPPADADAVPVPGEPGADKAGDLRVRVSNDANSKRESFTLNWDDDAKGAPIPVYVPPGESRVVRVPRPTGVSIRVQTPPAPAQVIYAPGQSGGSLRGGSLRLGGDTRDFDNMLYLATTPDDAATVLFLGGDAADDPNGLLYYLIRAFEASPRRTVKVEARAPTELLTIDAERPAALIVVGAETAPANVAVLSKFANEGGTVLVVAASGKVATLSGLAGVPAMEIEDATVRGDVMLGEIAFDHPLFAPFAGPQFNDFTKIRFWKYRKLPADAIEGVRVVARFETGDPAVIEKPMGKGRLIVFLSGWSPADGQLARSSKFVPLMSALLDGPNAGAETATSILVHEPLTLPEGATAVHKPDATIVKLAPETTTFGETDAPGVYMIDLKEGLRPVAVNLDPMESKTAPLAVETLEQFGCRLARGPHVAADRETVRQMQNAELEGRQKLWRPVILLAIAVLTVETWLAGRLGRSRPVQEGATA